MDKPKCKDCPYAIRMDRAIEDWRYICYRMGTSIQYATEFTQKMMEENKKLLHRIHTEGMDKIHML